MKKTIIQLLSAAAVMVPYMAAVEQELPRIGVRITYCNMASEEVRYFEQEFSFAELASWYGELLEEVLQAIEVAMVVIQQV